MATITKVYSQETKNESDELRKQSKEISDYLFCQSMFEHKDVNRRRSAKKLFAYHDVPLAEAAEKYLKKLISEFSNTSERVNFLTTVKMDHADEDLRKAATKMLETQSAKDPNNVEPFESDMGASLTEDAGKERVALYKQCFHVLKKTLK
jgi:hypothetical protein